MSYQEEVIQVPDKHRFELLKAEEGLRIQGDDCDTWEIPTAEQRKLVIEFLEKHQSKRSWRVTCGLRYGCEKRGVYVFEHHHKRFFGIVKSHTSVMLQNQCQEAVPAFSAGGGFGGPDLLGKLASNMCTISDQVREDFLRATFQRADRNGNGTLSRPELGTMMRKVLNTMSASQVREMMQEADKDNSGNISYKEFCHWLHAEASEAIQNGVKRSLSSKADFVAATFRLWDVDGDGVVSKSNLKRAMAVSCKKMSDKQIDSLLDVIDTGDDGTISYDEFIEFLFKRK
eukprot:TRINITY_DN94261_c0_g1_i1.p1 TRINITY_DN94261_c0_g1~~TRINITY_DN94261_c0_g1_i1.p1  ORF type:complete len:286 (-),score=58.41 TRINITY_DN94261_c0_g1_i1:108-965(-)